MYTKLEKLTIIYKMVKKFSMNRYFTKKGKEIVTVKKHIKEFVFSLDFFKNELNKNIL